VCWRTESAPRAVKTAIFSEPSLKSLQIHVETYKNVVQLSGFAR
jgi:osmotically-inducible protein OsmY